MKKLSSRIVPVMLVLAMVTGGALLWAQERGDRGERGERRGGDRPDARQFDRGDREQMRERISERTREQLGVSQDEWEVLEPMIDNVRTLEAQGSVRGGMGFGRGGRGGFRGGMGGDEDRELSAVEEASRDLGRTLRDENASEADIQQRLEALRSARESHQQQLEEAREELRSVLTPRQEAQLVIMGVLD